MSRPQAGGWFTPSVCDDTKSNPTYQCLRGIFFTFGGLSANSHTWCQECLQKKKALFQLCCVTSGEIRTGPSHLPLLQDGCMWFRKRRGSEGDQPSKHFALCMLNSEFFSQFSGCVLKAMMGRTHQTPPYLYILVFLVIFNFFLCISWTWNSLF